MAERQLPEDFKEFLKCLNSHKVGNIISALEDFGIKGVQKEFFMKKDNTFKIGRPPLRIDILNKALGMAANRPKDLADIVELKRMQ